MFKAYSVSLLNALLFFSLSLQAANYSGGSSELTPEMEYPASVNPHDAFGLHQNAATRSEALMNPTRCIPDGKFTMMLKNYTTDLPTTAQAQNTINRIVQIHPPLSGIIERIKDPNLCKRARYPSRLLFVGPSGCGKTRAAKAIAKYCNSKCIFIEGSEIGNTYQNSGSTTITDLFKGLVERSDERFIVIIDEFMNVAKIINEDKELQQNKTVTALWEAFDKCLNKRHVCVIGTDNGDPDKLAKALKTRLAHKIFTFEHMGLGNIVEVIKESLGYAPHDDVPGCSDKFLHKFAQLVEKVSIREIEDLVEESKALAILESKDPDAIVTEDHIMRTFNMYRDPTPIEKAWKDRNKHWGNLTSARSIATGMVVAGTGIKLYDSYRRNGFTLSTGAALLLGTAYAIKYCYPKEEKEDTNDLQFFNAVNHLTDQHESHMQWETSHAFNVQNNEEARVARVQDTERADRGEARADEQLEHSRNADKRAEEQMEQAREAHERAKEDVIRQLKESLKQIAMDRSKEGYVPSDALNKHEAFIKEKLYKLKPDERPQEPVKEKGLFSFIWG